MSDANKYINTYVDIAVSSIHEQINTIIQMKTQAKLANDLIKEKDEVISNLRKELEERSDKEGEYSQAVQNASKWEEECNALKSKVVHMDTLTSQYNDLKNQFVEKNKLIESLNTQLSEITAERDNTKRELETTRQNLENNRQELENIKRVLEEKTIELNELNSVPKKSSPKKVINTKNTENTKVVSEDKADDDF